MDRERIGLQARLCQFGRHKPARRLTEFEAVLRLLRRGVMIGWLRSWPLFTVSAGWIALLSASALFYWLSLLLSACERLAKNRWMDSLRQNRFRTFTALLLEFTGRDAWLAVRIAVYYRLHLFGRALMLFTAPILLTAASGWFVFYNGVSRAVMTGGGVCLLLLWLGALFFFLAAREPLYAAVALLTDRSSFAKRKSSLTRLDKDCFQLTRFSFSWLLLSNGTRFQARAIYASIRQ